jgi:hypothetical protein
MQTDRVTLTKEQTFETHQTQELTVSYNKQGYAVLSTLTVDELKVLLRSRGGQVTGRKDELVHRMLALAAAKLR